MIDYVASARARVDPGAVGAGSLTELGRYIDEVDDQITAFDAWVRELEHAGGGADHLSHGFFIGWADYVERDPFYLEPTTGRPRGWKSFFHAYEGLLAKALSNDPIWSTAELFEDELVRFWDEAKNSGATPPIPRPERGFQPPPPGETPEGIALGFLKAFTVIGGIADVGYVLHGVGRVR